MKRNQIIIANEGKQALYEVFRTICEEGDEVLIPTPCYVSYSEQIKLTGAKPVFFETKEENHFRPTLEEVSKDFNPGVKTFISTAPITLPVQFLRRNSWRKSRHS